MGDEHWLRALYDPMAGLTAMTSNMCVADVYADGDFKLLVADGDRRLKVYKGGTIQSEHALLGEPAAVCTFFSDLQQPRTPAIAVASGQSVFIYRNLRPYFKFTVPAIELSPEEVETWSELSNGKKNIPEATAFLSSLRERGIPLSAQSSDLLALDNLKVQEQFVGRHVDFDSKLIQPSATTCMGTLNKSMTEWDAISCLVIGTTAGQILILDSKGAMIKTKTQLPSIPVYMAITGLYDVEYRIVVATRNGSIYSIKNGELMHSVVELESQICGLLFVSKMIVTACMDKTVHSFHIKGKKNWSMTMPHHISTLENMNLKRRKNSNGFLVALSTGEVRFYKEKQLMSTIKTPGPISGLRFGPFGREEAALTIIHNSGAITVKLLRRSATFEASSEDTGPPPEQDIPLNIPKKTKLYVEQTQRERDQASEMHRIFQKDLCKLRLTTARAYVKIITEGQGPVANTSGVTIRLTAQVHGIGPYFKISLNLQNASSKTVSDIPIAFHFDHELYRMKQSLLTVPLLLPSIQYQYSVDVESLSETGAADDVYVFVCGRNSCVPLVSAVVNMPISEALFDT